MRRRLRALRQNAEECAPSGTGAGREDEALALPQTQQTLMLLARDANPPAPREGHRPRRHVRRLFLNPERPRLDDGQGGVGDVPTLRPQRHARSRDRGLAPTTPPLGTVPLHARRALLCDRQRVSPSAGVAGIVGWGRREPAVKPGRLRRNTQLVADPGRGARPSAARAAKHTERRAYRKVCADLEPGSRFLSGPTAISRPRRQSPPSPVAS